MISDDREILIRALKREKAARKEAEKILEEKSLEFYEISRKLDIANVALGKKSKQKKQPKVQYSSLPDAIVRIDLKGNILKMNEAAVALFGYNVAQESVNALNLIHRDDFSYTMNSFKELLNKGTFTDFVARVYTKNGPPKLVHINSSLVYNSEGIAFGAEGIVRDITEESRSRRLIETQRAELSAIVNHSPLGITLTEKGVIKKHNKAFQDMIGYSNTEMRNFNPIHLIREEDKASFIKLKNDFNSGLKNYAEYISLLIKKDGSLILAKIIVSSILDEKKHPKYVLFMFEDITEKEEQNKLFKEQQRQLKIIVENSPLGIILIKDNVITRANHTFESIMGYSQEELNNISILDITSKKDIEKTKGFLNKVQSDSQSNTTLKHRLVKKNLSQITVKTNVSTVNNQAGDPDYLVVMIEDITEHEKTEKQKGRLLKKLKISNKDLQEYAHVVSHDLKSPLRNINTLTSWVKEDYQLMDKVSGLKHLNLIDSMVEKMESLINGVLTYSKVVNTKVKNKEVSLDQTFKDILDIVFIPTHISFSIPKKLPTVIGDEIRMQQLFQNLICNSIKYIDKKEGKIEIGCTNEKQHSIISIKDNGMGINPKYHHKIFEMFQTLNAEEKNNTYGIGLTIAKKIVELFDGEIYLKSKEGIGTTFFVKLKKSRQII